MKDQIKSIESKVEAAYQTLIAITEDQNFKSIKMECIWKLVKTCIIPIITYASETWEPLKSFVFAGMILRTILVEHSKN